MKIIFYSILLTSFVFVNTIKGQSKPPKSSKTKTISSSKTLSTTYDSDNGNHSSSVSVTENNDSYRFKATFSEKLSPRVISEIEKTLQKYSFVKRKGNKWVIIKNDKKTFTCKYTDGFVKIYVNRKKVSNSFYKNVVELGEVLKNKISN